LSKALVESGLGEDLSSVCGIDNDLIDSVFTLGLRGVQRGAEKKVESIIMDTLERLVRDGIPKGEIEAAMLAIEFSNREIKRAQGPYSLALMLRSLRAWLHGKAPWESLLFEPYWKTLKEEAAKNDRFFEDIISDQFLKNPHRALVTVQPEKDFLANEEKSFKDYVQKKEAALTVADRDRLKAESLELSRCQNEADDPAALAAIPHLSLSDLSPKPDSVKRELFDAGGVPCLSHTLRTNGISYVDAAFPVDIFDPDTYIWLPLFSRLVTSVGAAGKKWDEMSSLLARTVGDVYTFLRTSSAVEGTSRTISTPGGFFDIAGRDWLVFRMKTLDEKIDASLSLMMDLVRDADFTDQKRLRDLILEMKNDADTAFAPHGHGFAVNRASRFLSHSKAVDEIWNGIEQLFFIHEVSKMDIKTVSKKLIAIKDTLQHCGCIISLTSENGEASIERLGKTFGVLGPPRPPLVKDSQFFMKDYKFVTGNETTEVFSSDSLQVGFAGAAMKGAAYTSREHAAEQVLSHYLSTGALWEKIRMQGGAYGANAGCDGLERVFHFSTYRDGQPLASLAAFPKILEEESRRTPDAATLEKMIIGTYSRLKQPRSPSDNGLTDFMRFLYNIEDAHREALLQNVIDTDAAALQGRAAHLSATARSAAELRSVVAITGKKDAKKAAAALGVRAKELPI
jgi:Zn-dependent M16 (insulinase) family peptidase